MMFTMDVPTVPAQETPIVLAQAATPAASTTPQPDYILNTCKETESTGDEMSAIRGVNPVGMFAAYLENYAQRVIDSATEATIRPILLQAPTHGKLNRHVAENGQVYFMYDPAPDYVGHDKAIFMAEFEGKRYKIVVELHVFNYAPPGEFGASTCPKPKLIKATKPAKPSSGASGFGEGYDLSSVSVTFAGLAGGAVIHSTP